MTMTREEREIIQAIIQEGPAPWHHRKTMAELRRNWPVMAHALSALLIRHGYAVPKELLK